MGVDWQGQLTRSDLARAYRAHLWTSRLRLVLAPLLACGCALTCPCALVAVVLDPADGLGWLATLLPGLLCLVPLGAVMAIPLWKPWVAANRAYRANPALRQPISGTASADGLRIRTAVSDGLAAWGSWHHYLRRNSFALLYTSKDLFTVYPRRFFGGDDDWQAFVALVAEHVPSAADARSNRSVPPQPGSAATDRRAGELAMEPTPQGVPAGAIAFAGHLTACHIRRAVALHLRFPVWGRVLVVAMVTIIAVTAVANGAAVVFPALQGDRVPGLAVLPILAVAEVLVSLPLWQPSRMIAALQRQLADPAASAYTVVASEEGLQLQGRGGSSVLLWGAFRCYRCMPAMTLLYLQSGCFYVYPREHFRSDEDWESFNALVRGKVQEGGPIGLGTPAGTLVVVSIVAFVGAFVLYQAFRGWLG